VVSQKHLTNIQVNELITAPYHRIPAQLSFLSDPYHTYLSLAAIAIHPPGPEITTAPSWKFKPLDPLLNANKETAEWARCHIPGTKTSFG